MQQNSYMKSQGQPGLARPMSPHPIQSRVSLNQSAVTSHPQGQALVQSTSHLPPQGSPSRLPLQASPLPSASRSPAPLRRCLTCPGGIELQEAPTSSSESREVMFTIFHPSSQSGCSSQPHVAVSQSQSNQCEAPVISMTSDTAGAGPGTPRRYAARNIKVSPMASPQPNPGSMLQSQSVSASSPNARLAPSPEILSQSRPIEGRSNDGVHVNLDRLQSLLKEFKGQHTARSTSTAGSAADTQRQTPEGPTIITLPPSAPITPPNISTVTVPGPPEALPISAALAPAALAGAASAVQQSAATTAPAGVVGVGAGVASTSVVPQNLPPGKVPSTSLEAWVQQKVRAVSASSGSRAVGPTVSGQVQPRQSPWMRSASAQRSAIRESSRRRSPPGQGAGLPQQPRSLSRDASASAVRATKLGGAASPSARQMPLGFHIQGLSQAFPQAIPALPFSSELGGPVGPMLPVPPFPPLTAAEGELPPPPRCAPAALNASQRPMSSMTRSAPSNPQGWSVDCPPPPRCAPATTNGYWPAATRGGGDAEPAPSTCRSSMADTELITQRLGFMGGDTERTEHGMTRSVVRPLPESVSAACHQYVLKVQMAEENWEPFPFIPSQSLERQAATFLQQHALKPAFQTGLIEKMQQMISAGMMHCSVDIVDLI